MYMSDRHTNMEQVQDAYQEIQSEVEYRNRQQSTISDFLSIRDVPEGLERMEYYAKCRKIYQQLLDQEPEKALKGFSELFAELQQERADEGKEESETTRIERLVDQAKHYIEAHYRESSLTAGKVSDELSINQSYLSREFKRINGVGILEYISQLRLEYAKKLLAEGATVREAALQIGYFDTQPLVRIFRQMEGITPREYRQSQQKNKLETEKK